MTDRPTPATLPTVEVVDALPAASLPGFVTELAGLLARAGMRLHHLALEEADEDCECLDAQAAARLLKCSVDLIRERGEQWGVAKVLVRDRRGRPSRIVYPRVLLRNYLRGEPERPGRAGTGAAQGSCAQNPGRASSTTRPTPSP